MQWLQHQITILMHICYRWNPLFIAEPESNAPKLLTEYHYYISDAPEHDTLFVQHCFARHWRHLTERGIIPNEHVVWSDGCAAQFKSRRCWYHVSKYFSYLVILLCCFFQFCTCYNQMRKSSIFDLQFPYPTGIHPRQSGRSYPMDVVWFEVTLEAVTERGYMTEQVRC